MANKRRSKIFDDSIQRNLHRVVKVIPKQEKTKSNEAKINGLLALQFFILLVSNGNKDSLLYFQVLQSLL
ncbi:13827_t:CDS:2 [Entrophospora sp. SA101]|nr:13827_t:CDS:2 [Entrophospora sp. SA101]